MQDERASRRSRADLPRRVEARVGCLAVETELVSIGMTDGTWELTVQKGKATLVCDTPGIRGTLLGRGFTTSPNAVVTVESRAVSAASSR